MRDFFHGYVGAQDPAEMNRLQQAVIEAALDRGRWEDALTAAFEANQTQTMAEILGRAAPDLIASGRVETIEKWLERCGDDALSTPSAALAGSEAAMWRGRFSHAQLLAERTLKVIGDSSPHRSRAARLASQAAYWLNDDEAALSHGLKAVEWAETPTDERTALWSAYLAALAQSSEKAEALLHSLSQRAGSDVDSALRVAIGRVAYASRKGSFKGAWHLLEPLLPLAEATRDPAVATSFLAQCAIVRVMAAEYEHGLALVTIALERSEKLGLTVALPQCVFWKALAEIGLRQIEQARASAERLHSLVVDPYTEIIDLQLKLRLQLALGASCEWHLYERDFSPQLQRVSVGDFYGVVGLGLTAAGMAEAPRFIELARSLSSSAEARYCVEFAELIAAFRREEPDAANHASSLARAADDDGMADAWVTAYRLCPEILTSVANSANWPTLRVVVERANDATFARGLGVSAFGDRTAGTATAALTRRETEVLDLLRMGLSNSEIAERLVISTSTAKVHVHHILEKLGVESRLQAALTPRESDWSPD